MTNHYRALYYIHIFLGKLYDGMNQGIQAEYVVFPNEAKIVDISTAACYTLALTETGDVYYWGRSQVKLYHNQGFI